jgi:hypothetical protein
VCFYNVLLLPAELCFSGTAACFHVPTLYQLYQLYQPNKLRTLFLQVECDVGAPQVNYRESISRPNDIRYVHKKQSGGSGQFADVAIKFEPGEPGTGFVFRSEIKGGAGALLFCL